ncbi:MAG: hypothetical protein Alpg2KO_03940 [Alphaproteobacteria bacterium]
MYSNEAMTHALPFPQLNRNDFRGYQVGPDGQVYDPASGRSFKTNMTGRQTLRMMQEGASEEQAAMHLAAQYTVPLATARNAVTKFLDLVRTRFGGAHPA